MSEVFSMDGPDLTKALPRPSMQNVQAVALYMVRANTSP
jgi:hypothetical protein